MPTKIPVHPEVESRLDKYNRITILLDQDEDQITEQFCRRLPNEKDNTFENRKKTFRDTFLNITQDLVTAPVNSVFAQGHKLEYKSDSSVIKEFNENVTRTNEKTPMSKYMKDFTGMYLRSFGSVCTIVDKPRAESNSLQDELVNGMPYLTNINLQDIINWELDEFGNFKWFVYKKTYAPLWEDPFVGEQPGGLELECMYTKNDYIVREKDGDVINNLSYIHNWGFVPVVVQGSFLLTQSDILGNAAMFQSSNSIIKFNNNLNVGNHELDKHGSALLLMHEESITSQNVKTDEEGNVEIKKHDNDGMLPWRGEQIPQYLIKEIKSSEFMDWAMYYQKSAIENERDLKSVAKKGTTGEQVQESGFAKMVDREPLEANLVSLSEDLELWYDKITDMAAKVLIKENDSSIEFDTDYDLRPLNQKYEELEKANKNKIEDVSLTLLKEHWKNIAPDVTRNADVLLVVNKEIDAYEPDEADEELDKIMKENFPGNE